MMYRFLGSVFAVVLVVASINANDKPLSFGVTAGTNLTGFVGSDAPSDGGWGWGFGGGLVVDYSVSEKFSIRSGADFDYRNYGTSSTRVGSIEITSTTTEMSINVPIMAMYHWGRWYVGLGFELGIPFDTKTETTTAGVPVSVKWDNRSVDFGTAVGAGFMLTQNLGIDIRSIWPYNNMNSSGGGSVQSHSERLSIIYLF